MVSFIPLNIRDDDSINYVLSNIDNAIQYGEDVEPKVCGCVIAADGLRRGGLIYRLFFWLLITYFY